MSGPLLQASGQIEGTKSKIYLNIMSPEEGKEGFPAYINEVNGRDRLPGHRVTLFVKGQGDNQFMQISGPIRKRDEDGRFVTMARTNEEGQYLDTKGDVVQNERNAARNFEYCTYLADPEDEKESIIYGTLANINVQNEKKGGAPTKFTLLRAKLFTDEEAMEVARLLFERRQLPEDSPALKDYDERINAMRREQGTWTTLFIERGYDFLADLGFESRPHEMEQESTPSP